MKLLQVYVPTLKEDFYVNTQWEQLYYIYIKAINTDCLMILKVFIVMFWSQYYMLNESTQGFTK